MTFSEDAHGIKQRDIKKSKHKVVAKKKKGGKKGIRGQRISHTHTWQIQINTLLIFNPKPNAKECWGSEMLFHYHRQENGRINPHGE